MKIVMIGAGGHGKVVLDMLLLSGWEVVGVIDDNKALAGTDFCGIPILGGSARLPEVHRDASHAIVGIGDNRTRVNKAAVLRSLGFELATAVHPHAIVSRRAVLEPGTVVMGGAVVNADTRIGASAIVNAGATVDHDCDLAEGVHISPGAHLAGGVRVGALAHIGIGASVIENITIGQGAVVGAGAAVVEDVPAGVLVVGVPARVARRKAR